MNIIISDGLHFLQFCLVLYFAVQPSNCQCSIGLCEKKSLSLKTNTKHNFFLEGYVFEALNVSLWKECFNVCVRKCQCLSFNFNEVNKTENCELSDVTAKLEPEALKEKKNVTYYEIGRTYLDRNGFSRPACSDENCQNKCCESGPCQHGGTCHEVCDVTRRRFNCSCPPGFIGHKCQFMLRSCKDVMKFSNLKTSGIYHVMDYNNSSFPVLCDFGSEPGMAWTLIQSHSLKNNDAFKRKPFYQHDMPSNQNAPEWNSYRLSMSRMKLIGNVSTHWRATCNFPTDGVDFRDYWRVSLKTLNMLDTPHHACLLSEYVNVRGMKCSDCTVWCAYDSQYSLHLDSHYGQSRGCDFYGGIFNEDNFGFYGVYHSAFRCTSSMSSTSQYWLGSL